MNGEVGGTDDKSTIFNHILACHVSPGLTHFFRLYQDVTVNAKVIKKENRYAAILVLYSNRLVTQCSCDTICEICFVK